MSELTDEQLEIMIKRGRFPKNLQWGQKVEIRDLWLQGKTKQAYEKLRRLISPAMKEKSLL